MPHMTKRPIVPTCGMCGAMAMVTEDLKLDDVRDAAAVGFLMGLGAAHLGNPPCAQCRAEIEAIMRFARTKKGS
jgi:hypothetical protein